MNKLTIQTAVLSNHGNPLPAATTAGAAGADLRSIETLRINPGQRQLIMTGHAIAIPEGFVGLVCPRSGLALKQGLTVLNAPGVIDSDYRGEVGVILHNTSQEPQWVKDGDRVAQLVFMPVATAEFVEVSSLDETDRGEGGFGSTGVQ